MEDANGGTDLERRTHAEEVIDKFATAFTKGMTHMAIARQLLGEIQREQLWRDAGYDSLDLMIRDRFRGLGIQERYGRFLAAAGQAEHNLDELLRLPAVPKDKQGRPAMTERQLRPLARLNHVPDVQRRVFKEAITKAAGRKLAAVDITRALRAVAPEFSGKHGRVPDSPDVHHWNHRINKLHGLIFNADQYAVELGFPVGHPIRKALVAACEGLKVPLDYADHDPPAS